MATTPADRSPREQLRRLRAETDAAEVSTREWNMVVGDAHATALTATAIASAMAARTDGAAHGRDALALGVDALLTYEADPLRDQLREALRRVSPDTYASADLDNIAERLGAMSDVQLGGLMNSVQGTMLELQVDELLEAHAIEWPEDAASYELAGRNEQAVDGWFFDDEGQVLQPFQVKASESLGPAREHLREHPDVDLVYADSDSAELADVAGLDTVEDTGVSLRELLPNPFGEASDPSEDFVDEFMTSAVEGVTQVASQLPLITGALIGGELVWAKLRGGDMSVARSQAQSRGLSAATFWGAASAVSMATGLDSARLVIVVGGKSSQWALARVDAELAPSIGHIRQLRQVVTGAAGNPTA